MSFPVLRWGSTGQHVSSWQIFLQLHHAYDGSVDGSFGPKTDKGTRLYQQKKALLVDGVVGQETYYAAFSDGLLFVDDDAPDESVDDGDAHGGPGDHDNSSEYASVHPDNDLVPWIQDRQALGTKINPSRIKGERSAADVYGIVLHQMGFSRGQGDDLGRFDRVCAHYVIGRGGQIGQLHPHTTTLNASDKLNNWTISCEFVGNLPSIYGKWYKSHKFGAHNLTPQQVSAGRFLLKHLRDSSGITHVFGHIQSGGKNRGNCPGPDIWSSIGQWGLDELELSDGGADYVVGKGLAIPEKWRTWGLR